MYGNGYYMDTGMMAVFLVVFAVLFLFGVITSWRLFQKAGEPGWAALIPFYNVFVYYRVVWGSGAKMFLMLIPIYNIIFAFQTIFRTAKVYGKGVGFGFGLLFLSPIFLLILAFGDAQYVGPDNARARQTVYEPVQGSGAAYGGQDPYAGYRAQPPQYQPPAAPTGPQGEKFCPNCGQRLSADARFCPGCGAAQK